MTDNNNVESNRAKHIARLREKYPEKQFEDDEEIYGQISDDYDQYEQQLGEYSKNEKALSDMFEADPRSAQFLVDMHNGNDPVVGLVRHFGMEIRDVLDDPQMQDKIAEANKEYVERIANNRRLEQEYNQNMENTLETLREFQEQKGLSDEDVDRVIEALLSIVNDGVMGKFAPETLEMVCKAINYDTDIEAAGQEGEVAGRNAKITERLRQSRRGDGTMPLAGSNGTDSEGRSRGQNMFDLAAEAM